LFAYEIKINTFPDLIIAGAVGIFLLYALRWKRGHPYKVDLTVHLKQEEEDERNTGRSNKERSGDG